MPMLTLLRASVKMSMLQF